MICRWTNCARRHRQSVSWLQWRSRVYSSLRSVEQVLIPCQSHGSISIDIHHPLNRSSDVATHPSTILLHLPGGPLKRDEERDGSFLSILRSHLEYAIVQINYRIGQDNQYPTPIHDVLAGYDWIVENMLPKRAIARAGRPDHVGRLAVCGEHIGGSLATMLALTECRVGEPRVIAAAVHNPLLDWVSLTHKPRTSSSSKGRRSKTTTLSTRDLEELIQLREQMFKRPDDYFDAFASPILFFRSAGVEVPTAPKIAPQDDMEYLSRLEREAVVVQEDPQDPAPPIDAEATNEQPTSAPRRVSRRFPSKILRLRLPSFLVTSPFNSPLREQAEEFAKLYSKSLIRNDSGESADFGRKVLLDEEVEKGDSLSLQNVSEKMQTRIDEEDGSDRALKVAKWLETALC